MADKRILRLPEEVVGKIAAGEVVESPAAALKELIENSIDAGATAVTVETREGGIAYFRVTDNGHGIPAEDIRMAFERHATSKIRTADDLFAVQSLGFRGEALASIAAVAKVTLTTRTRQEERGTKAVNTGGVFESINDAASPEGTTIIVQDLFYNTPARLKFLKKPSTEGARVADMVLRMLLSNPSVSFRLIQNDKQVYHSPGDGKLPSAIYAAYGRETMEQLFAVQGQDGGIRVDGLVGIGPAARGNRSHQSFFINGRFVRSPLLTQALETACRERVVTGQFPLCVLHLHVPATLVDVNVHPNKLEVRFSNEALVLGSVSHIIHEALTKDAIASAPHIALDEKSPKNAITNQPPARVEASDPQAAAGAAPATTPTPAVPESAPPAPRFAEAVQDFFATMEPPKVRMRLRESGYVPGLPPRNLPFAPYPDAKEATPAPMVSAPVSAKPIAEVLPPIAAPTPSFTEQPFAAQPFKVLGVAFHTYIIIEQGSQLLLIDQHAAHERLLYEKLMKSLAEGTGSQQLLVPQVVSITPLEKERLLAYWDEVAAAGFEAELFGEDAVQIRAVPIVLGEPEAKRAFTDMLDQLGELRVLATKQKRREAILQMSCKKAIKGGDALSEAEIVALLVEMQASEAPPTCPHGRPLVVVLTRTELEKRFKRIV